MTKSTQPTHWERLGFQDDPYHVGPLPVAAISAELFVGRTVDRERLRGYLDNLPTGKTMVQGVAGVGKTSLVNVVQHELFAAQKRFPLFEVVETTAGATREDFLLWVLSAVVSSLRSVFGEDDVAAEGEFRAARDAVTQVLSLGLTGSVSFPFVPGGPSAGLSQAARSTGPLAITVPTLLHLLRGLVDMIARRGFRGLVVPVNNLDQLGNTAAVQFLSLVRDVTAAVEGVHWVFIGGEHLFETLEAESRRVSESFSSNPISIGPLTWEDVHEALERRRRAFAVNSSTQLPISLGVARLVNQAAHGELRFTFARLSRTVLDFTIQYPSERSVPDAVAVRMLQEWARGQLAQSPITPRQRDVVEHLVAHGTVRSKDYRSAGFTTPQQLSNLLRTLQQKQYVVPISEEGTSRTYALSPAAFLSQVDRVGRYPLLAE